MELVDDVPSYRVFCLSLPPELHAASIEQQSPLSTEDVRALSGRLRETGDEGGFGRRWFRQITMWIGVDDSLLRRSLVQRWACEPQVIVIEHWVEDTYCPEIDAIIDPSVFDYGPPADATWNTGFGYHAREIGLQAAEAVYDAVTGLWD